MKTKVFAVLCISMLLSGALSAQLENITMLSMGFACSDIPSDCLMEVHFDGEVGTNYLPIKRDNGEGAYMAPQLEKTYSLCTPGNLGTVITQHPVAYVSGTKAMVKAVFETTRTSIYFIKGVAPEGMEFPAQEITPSNGTGIYDFEQANIAFPVDVVRYFENFQIQWKVSLDGETNWTNIGFSLHELYVTHKAPLAEIPGFDATGEEYKNGIGYEWFESLFYISCKNATTENDKVNITSAIWNDFTDHEVNGKSGKLYYYLHWALPAYTTNTGSLLEFRDGQCYSWCSLLIDLLKLQGIDQANDIVTITGSFSGLCDASMFLVKEWQISDEPTQYAEVLDTYCPDCTHANLGPRFDDPSMMDELWINNENGVYSYNFYVTEATDENGVIGQSAPNPESWFSEHCLVYLDYMGLFYDPSYGTAYANLDDWRDNSLSAWGCLTQQYEFVFDMDFNDNGTMEEQMTFMGINPDLNSENVLPQYFNR